MRLAVLASLLIAGSIGVAAAAEDKYKITREERVACTMDAVRLCSGAYPDEDLLLACMRRNRASLSQACLVAFDAGLKRRHL